MPLLEDGIPLAYAPYGDNVSYYHPPIDRFERIEVLKGAGQIMFGPQTTGAVINHITPLPPRTPAAARRCTAGNRDSRQCHVRYPGGNNMLLDPTPASRATGRATTWTSVLNDLNHKAVLDRWRSAGADRARELLAARTRT